MTAKLSEPHHSLPTILGRAELAQAIHGQSVQIGGIDITLNRELFSVDEQLVWESCDQSRSAFLPFYVVRQPREGKSQRDKVYVRVDGRIAPMLTHTLAGA